MSALDYEMWVDLDQNTRQRDKTSRYSEQISKGVCRQTIPNCSQVNQIDRLFRIMHCDQPRPFFRM